MHDEEVEEVDELQHASGQKAEAELLMSQRETLSWNPRDAAAPGDDIAGDKPFDSHKAPKYLSEFPRARGHQTLGNESGITQCFCSSMGGIGFRNWSKG